MRERAANHFADDGRSGGPPQRHRPAARRLLVVRPVLGRVGDPGVRVPGRPPDHRRAHRRVLHAAVLDRGRRDAARGAAAAAVRAVHDRPALARHHERRDVRGRLPAHRRHPGGVRAPWCRERPGRRVHERRGPAVRSPDEQARPAMDARDVRARRHHRSVSGRRAPGGRYRFPGRVRVRGHRARGHLGLDVIGRTERAARRGHADAVLDLRVVPDAEAPGACSDRPVRVPDRGIDGCVVGAVPSQRARSVREHRRHGVRRVRVRSAIRTTLREPRPVSGWDGARRSSSPVSAR